jgi:hypothetical protein
LSQAEAEEATLGVGGREGRRAALVAGSLAEEASAERNWKVETERIRPARGEWEKIIWIAKSISSSLAILTWKILWFAKLLNYLLSKKEVISNSLAKLTPKIKDPQFFFPRKPHNLFFFFFSRNSLSLIPVTREGHRRPPPRLLPVAARAAQPVRLAANRAPAREGGE